MFYVRSWATIKNTRIKILEPKPDDSLSVVCENEEENLKEKTSSVSQTSSTCTEYSDLSLPYKTQENLENSDKSKSNIKIIFSRHNTRESTTNIESTEKDCLTSTSNSNSMKTVDSLKNVEKPNRKVGDGTQSVKVIKNNVSAKKSTNNNFKKTDQNESKTKNSNVLKKTSNSQKNSNFKETSNEKTSKLNISTSKKTRSLGKPSLTTNSKIGQEKISNRNLNVTSKMSMKNHLNKIHVPRTHSSHKCRHRKASKYVSKRKHNGSGDVSGSKPPPNTSTNEKFMHYCNMTEEEFQKREKFRRINMKILEAVADLEANKENEVSSVDSDEDEVSEIESLERIRRLAEEEEEDEAMDQQALQSCLFLNEHYPFYFERLIKRYQLNENILDYDEVKRKKLDIIRIATEDREKLIHLETMYRQRDM